MKPIIETERLILREFVPEDYEAVYAYSSNEEVCRYTGEPPLESLEKAKWIIKMVRSTDYKVYGYGRWAAVYKRENKVIGFAGLKYLPQYDAVDLGYRFLPEHWGKGLATEASKALVKYGFEVLELDKIIGVTMPGNIASSRVLEKVGMHLYKVAEYDGDGEENNWYKIEKESYLQQ